MLAVLAAVAEMERDLIVERTQAGLARARSEGKALGRPAKTTLEQRRAMIQRFEAKQSISALARLYGVSRATVLTIVKPSHEVDSNATVDSRPTVDPRIDVKSGGFD